MTLLLRVVVTALPAAAGVAGALYVNAAYALVILSAVLCGALGHWLYLLGVEQPLLAASKQIDALRASDALIRSFMDNAPFVIAAKDRDGRYLSANAEFMRLHGVTLEALRGQRDRDFMDADTACAVQSHDQEVLESGQTRTYTIPIQTGNGQRMMDAVKFPILDATRHIVGIGLMATDVTEREVSNEKFERVFHSSPNWIVITRLADGVVIDANEGFEQISGHPRKQAIGQSISNLAIWVNPEQRAAIVKDLMRDGQVVDALVQMRRRDGEVRDCIANASLISLEGQTRSHAVWIARDVTAEQAVHEQFVAAFRLTPDFMSISRASDGRYVEANEAFERFTGYRRSEVIGRTSVEIGLWHDPTQRSAMIKVLERDKEVRDFPVELRDRNGQVRQGLGYAALFETRGERYMIAMMRDVTDAHLAEQALRESEARFANLFEMSPLPTSYSFDTDDYTAVYRNSAFYSTFGYRRGTDSGKSTAEIGFWVHAQDAERARQLRLAGAPVDNWVVEVRHADGCHRWVSLFGRFIVEPYRKIVVTTIFDITEQRLAQLEIEELNSRLEDRVRERTVQLEAANGELSQALQTLEQATDRLVQSEKLASLGALVAGVAHELNTPIGNGLTVASTLDERVREFALAAKGPMQRSFLDHFVHETQYAADLLVRSLTRSAGLISSFKQVAVDQTSSQRREFDLAHLLDEVLMTISPAIRRAQCEVVSNVPPGLLLDSYPGPLVQVLTNLINNALLHGFEAGQGGRVRIFALTVNPETVEISVQDNGKGIAAVNIKRIFDPFFTTRLGQGGSGLGLHIVHNIVTSVLGGRIDVRTVVGQGCEFLVKLPIVAPRVADVDSQS
jgi:PAS domain S-box-containing protein